MANSISFTASIYRLTSTGDTESNIPDDEAIGLEYGMKDTSSIGIISWEWDIPSRHTDVPAPANKALTNPDTGLAPLTLKIGIKVNEKVTGNRQVGILSLWGLQDKEVRNVFSKGRFGIRNDKKPWMNYIPVNEAGWKLVDVNIDDVLQWGGMIDALLTLEFGGQAKLLAAAIQHTLNSGSY